MLTMEMAVPCHVCNKKFSTIYSLKRHLRQVHGPANDDDTRSVAGSVCSEQTGVTETSTTTTGSSLKQHLRKLHGPANDDDDTHSVAGSVSSRWSEQTGGSSTTSSTTSVSTNDTREESDEEKQERRERKAWRGLIEEVLEEQKLPVKLTKEDLLQEPLLTKFIKLLHMQLRCYQRVVDAIENGGIYEELEKTKMNLIDKGYSRREASERTLEKRKFLYKKLLEENFDLFEDA